MREYTFSEARQNLAALLDQALREGKVQIRRRNGSTFIIQPSQKSKKASLDVPGVNLNLSREEILAAVHEARKPH